MKFAHFKGQLQLVRNGVSVAGIPPFNVAPGAVVPPPPQPPLMLEQGLYEVRPVGTPDVSRLLNDGGFDFTGKPREGGDHVEEL